MFSIYFFVYRDPEVFFFESRTRLHTLVSRILLYPHCAHALVPLHIFGFISRVFARVRIIDLYRIYFVWEHRSG